MLCCISRAKDGHDQVLITARIDSPVQKANVVLFSSRKCQRMNKYAPRGLCRRILQMFRACRKPSLRTVGKAGFRRIERLEVREVLSANYSLIDINSSGGLTFGKTAVINNDLYYIDSDPQHGTELRVLDTETNSVSLVADINPGFASSGIGEFGGLVSVGSKLFFTANDGVSGPMLWWLDAGEANPTVNAIKVAGDYIFTNPGEFGGFTVIGSRLYFSAFDSSEGYELRWIDTAAPGQIVHTVSVNPGPASSYAGQYGGFKAVGDKVYFSANDSLRKHVLCGSVGR